VRGCGNSRGRDEHENGLGGSLYRRQSTENSGGRRSSDEQILQPGGVELSEGVEERGGRELCRGAFRRVGSVRARWRSGRGGAVAHGNLGQRLKMP
jgi:hypothetical protein